MSSKTVSPEARQSPDRRWVHPTSSLGSGRAPERLAGLENGEARAAGPAARDLSWLDLSRRVLACAEDPGLPPLKRLESLARASACIDAFFELHGARLQARARRGGEAPHSEIRERVLSLVHARDRIFCELRDGLERAGMQLATWADVPRRDRLALRRSFEQWILPVITPLSVGAARPFPRVSSLSLNLAVLGVDPADARDSFGVIGVPATQSRFLPLESGRGLVPIEVVLAAHLELLFPGMEILCHACFRVTRASDPATRAASEVAAGLHRAGRRSRGAVRLEIEQSMPSDLREILMHHTGLGEREVYSQRAPLDLGTLWELQQPDRLHPGGPLP